MNDRIVILKKFIFSNSVFAFPSFYYFLIQIFKCLKFEV